MEKTISLMARAATAVSMAVALVSSPVWSETLVNREAKSSRLDVTSARSDASPSNNDALKLLQAAIRCGSDVQTNLRNAKDEPTAGVSEYSFAGDAKNFLFRELRTYVSASEKSAFDNNSEGAWADITRLQLKGRFVKVWCPNCSLSTRDHESKVGVESKLSGSSLEPNPAFLFQLCDQQAAENVAIAIEALSGIKMQNEMPSAERTPPANSNGEAQASSLFSSSPLAQAAGPLSSSRPATTETQVSGVVPGNTPQRVRTNRVNGRSE